MDLRSLLDSRFQLTSHNTTARTELLAGLTTFLTMSYIVFVNPSILSETGMPAAAVTVSTCLCAGLGSILMGLLANLPLALAPGMGLNAYFTYTVVRGLGVPWPTALAAVFVSGVLFLVLTATGLRQRLLSAIPSELHAAVAGGIGLFIALIGLRNAGIIVPSASTTLTLGNLHHPAAALSCFGLLLTAVLQALRVRTSILLGILGTLLLGILTRQIAWHPQPLALAAVRSTAFHLDFAGLARVPFAEIIFVFLFVDLFDNIGTLVAVTTQAGLMRADGVIPRLNRIFFADASATILGSLAGTSTVTSYIESAAGVAIGGRTGLTSVTTGLLFLLALFVVPLIGSVPSFATSPALILVGALMLGNVARIHWSEPRVSTPAFLTLITIPLTGSIANGLSLGLIAFAALELLTGHASRRHLPLYLLAAVFLARFLLMAKG